MSGLQTIIDNCNGIEIDRRKVVGTQYTRNEIPRTSVTPGKNPWKIKLDMPTNFKYSDARALMEALDVLDRVSPEVITFSNNNNLSWIFMYQGVMTIGQRNVLTVTTFVGDELVLGGLPAIGSGAVLFEPNDLIQIGDHYYPFTSTTQILRGGGGTVTITTNRPNIITDSVVGDGLTVGNDCNFTMFCPNMPTYKLIPGGVKYNSAHDRINNAYIEWSDSFQLYEYVGEA